MAADKLVKVELIETVKIVLKTPDGEQFLLLDRADALELHDQLGSALKIKLGY